MASQMEQWLIFSKVVNYVQYDRNPGNFYNLEVKALEEKYQRQIYCKGAYVDALL